MPAQQKSQMRTRRQDKARNDRQKAVSRQACVDAVWARADSQCEVCRCYVVRPGVASFVMGVGHVHEVVYRSRGGSPRNPENCQLLCPYCHALAHGLRVGRTV